MSKLRKTRLPGLSGNVVESLADPVKEMMDHEGVQGQGRAEIRTNRGAPSGLTVIGYCDGSHVLKVQLAIRGLKQTVELPIASQNGQPRDYGAVQRHVEDVAGRYDFSKLRG